MTIRHRIWKTFLLVVFAIASNTLLAANISETDVAAAMKHSESSAHDIHNDSLRVWKNYNHGTPCSKMKCNALECLLIRQAQKGVANERIQTIRI
jgi:hypothetical protein